MPHILLVDDEPLIAMAFEHFLTEAGYRVTLAMNGSTALACFEADPADIIVTDHRMPRMNGADLLRGARVLRPGTPAIVISGYPSELGPVDDLGDGETVILTKPVSTRIVFKVLEGLVGDGEVRPSAMRA
ncbi:MAG TPA: response regulator [Azospirillaceae bacterium]|nr:response regulator [Azospirillaceae bacterium]